MQRKETLIKGRCYSGVWLSHPREGVCVRGVCVRACALVWGVRETAVDHLAVAPNCLFVGRALAAFLLTSSSSSSPPCRILRLALYIPTNTVHFSHVVFMLALIPDSEQCNCTVIKRPSSLRRGQQGNASGSKWLPSDAQSYNNGSSLCCCYGGCVASAECSHWYKDHASSYSTVPILQ